MTGREEFVTALRRGGETIEELIAKIEILSSQIADLEEENLSLKEELKVIKNSATATSIVEDMMASGALPALQKEAKISELCRMDCEALSILRGVIPREARKEDNFSALM